MFMRLTCFLMILLIPSVFAMNLTDAMISMEFSSKDVRVDMLLNLSHVDEAVNLSFPSATKMFIDGEATQTISICSSCIRHIAFILSLKEDDAFEYKFSLPVQSQNVYMRAFLHKDIAGIQKIIPLPMRITPPSTIEWVLHDSEHIYIFLPFGEEIFSEELEETSSWILIIISLFLGSIGGIFLYRSWLQRFDEKNLPFISHEGLASDEVAVLSLFDRKHFHTQATLKRSLQWKSKRLEKTIKMLTKKAIISKEGSKIICLKAFD